jgi:hypothetical protein
VNEVADKIVQLEHGINPNAAPVVEEIRAVSKDATHV